MSPAVIANLPMIAVCGLFCAGCVLLDWLRSRRAK